MITILIVFGCVYVFIGALLGTGLVFEELQDRRTIEELSGDETKLEFVSIIGIIALVIVIWPYMLWEILMK